MTSAIFDGDKRGADAFQTIIYKKSLACICVR